MLNWPLGFRSGICGSRNFFLLGVVNEEKPGSSMNTKRRTGPGVDPNLISELGRPLSRSLSAKLAQSIYRFLI